MVQEHRDEYLSLRAAIESMSPKIGCVPQTLNDWVKHMKHDTFAFFAINPLICIGF